MRVTVHCESNIRISIIYQFFLACGCNRKMRASARIKLHANTLEKSHWLACGPVPRVDDGQTCDHSAKILAESLHRSWMVAPLLSAPVAPSLIDLLASLSAMWPNLATISQECPDWATEV